MASIQANQAGDFATGSTWVGGVVPTVGDIAYSNAYIVSITSNVQCDSLRNNNLTGWFEVSTNNVIIDADVLAEIQNTATLRFLAASPNVVNITGDIADGVTAANRITLGMYGNGTLNIHGNIGPGRGSSIIFYSNSSFANLNVFGSVSSNSDLASAISVTQADDVTIRITGDVFPNNSFAVATSIVRLQTNDSKLFVFGNVYVTNTALAVAVDNNGTNNEIVVEGTVTGKGHVGAIVCSTSAAITSSRITISGPVYNGRANNGIMKMAVLGGSIHFTNGSAQGLAWEFTNSSNNAMSLYFREGRPDVPDESDVLEGVTYSVANSLIGTLDVPPTGVVRRGVAYGNGAVGVAIHTQQDVADAAGPIIAAFGG